MPGCCHAGSPFKPCVLNPDRVAPIGGWLALFDGNTCVQADLRKLQLVEFETCQAGHGKLLKLFSSDALNFMETEMFYRWRRGRGQNDGAIALFFPEF